MAIINATPDSFYEGSRTPRADDVARRAERAVADGAAILDVGGYSSRPGADDVTPDEELRRVTLALETIRRRCPDTPGIDRYVPFRSSRRRDRTLRAVHSQRHNGRNGGPGDRRRRGETRRPADRDAHARHAADDADDDPLRRSDRGSARLLRRKDRLAARRGRDADRARPGFRLFENRGARTSACWAKCTGWANWAIRFWPAYPASR